MASHYNDTTVRISREAAREYVLDLFRFVLDRAETEDQEVNYWTDLLHRGQNPVEIFLHFVNSQENLERRATKQSVTGDAFPSGHFYSPVNNIQELQADQTRVFSPRVAHGIDLNAEGQAILFRLLKPKMLELPFTDDPGPPYRYHYANTSYGFGDAAVYWSMLSVFRPNKIIEVGSGYTSALALDAIDFLGLPTSCTFIDPYPDLLKQVSAPLGEKHRIIADRIQAVDPDIVRSLSANDILFIDSSHVVKTGSDVHFAITELLPRVERGVIIHFHDTFSSFEYPRSWILDQKKSWNELYFLQSFLMYNNKFEIIHFNHDLAVSSPQQYEDLPLEIRDRIKLNPGGGLWLRRI